MSENKTEKPTPRRRQKAREQGQVARSRDLSSILAVSGAFGLVAWQGYAGIEAWRNLLRHTFEFSQRRRANAHRLLIYMDRMDARQVCRAGDGNGVDIVAGRRTGTGRNRVRARGSGSQN